MTDFSSQILHPATLARGCCAHGRQKSGKNSRGDGLECLEHVKQPHGGGTGCAGARGPFAGGVNRHPEGGGGAGIIEGVAGGKTREAGGKTRGQGVILSRGQKMPPGFNPGALGL